MESFQDFVLEFDVCFSQESRGLIMFARLRLHATEDKAAFHIVESLKSKSRLSFRLTSLGASH